MNVLGFEHVYREGASDRTLLMLHGTGGDERDLVPLAERLDGQAGVLSPRGKVLERGMPRFFRRLAEGVFDVPDLIARANELADFVGAAAREYGFDAGKVVAVGFSNGANMAGAVLLLRPEVLRGAALWRPMVPLVPEKGPDLRGKKVLLTHGAFDGMTTEEERTRLARLFESAGAAVEAATMRAGHSLVEEDIERTRAWLAGV